MKVLIGLLLCLSNISWGGLNLGNVELGEGITVDVTSCDHWSYGANNNLLQMKLRGTNGTTRFEFVNPRGGLPMNGESETYTFTYDISSRAVIGDLLAVVFRVDDHPGYCIKDFNVRNYHHFTSDDWGDGIVLSNKCAYSYQFLSDELPLISCHENNFELKTDSQRGIYNVDIHTCQGKMGSDISAKNMKNNLYLSIMGNNNKIKDYLQTEVTYLDHYANSGGNIDLSLVGHKIASNGEIHNEQEQMPQWYYGTYSADLHDTYKIFDIHEKKYAIRGIKIESVNYLENPLGSGHNFDLNISNQLNGGHEILQEFSAQTFDDGRYLIKLFAGFGNKYLTQYSRMKLWSTGSSAFTGKYNVYLILWVQGSTSGFHPDYKLPYKFVIGGPESNDHKLSWFEANAYCRDEYGTSLASVHSDKETFMLDSEREKWIGLFQSDDGATKTWKWSDNTHFDEEKYASLTRDNITPAKDCGKIANKKVIGGHCWERLRMSVCASPNWLPNTHRKFQVNSDKKIDDITLVAIGNNNNVDDICIDSISVEGNTAKSVKPNWISGGEKSYAFFKYPVCGMEITRVDVKYDNSKATPIPQDSKIVGNKCANQNRLISTKCSVSQTVEKAKTTGFALDKAFLQTHGYSHGDQGEHSSDISSGSKFHIGVRTEQEFGVKGFAEAKVTSTIDSDTTYKENRGNSVSTSHDWTNTWENTNTTHRTWSKTSTTSVECSAEIELPPGHSMEYDLVFNAASVNIETFTDIKLTLCSEYIGDGEKYKYMKNIKGYIYGKETHACEVKFKPVVYLDNPMGCSDLQKLAIAVDDTYSPLCQTGNVTKFNGCQCHLGDESALGTCWCVDENGNPKPNTLKTVEDRSLWDKTCAVDLMCDNSYVGGKYGEHTQQSKQHADEIAGLATKRD